MITDINFWNKIVIVLSNKYPELFNIDLLEKCVNDRRLLEIQVHVYVDFTDNKVISISTVPIIIYPTGTESSCKYIVCACLYMHIQYTCIYSNFQFWWYIQIEGRVGCCQFSERTFFVLVHLKTNNIYLLQQENLAVKTYNNLSSFILR